MCHLVPTSVLTERHRVPEAFHYPHNLLNHNADGYDSCVIGSLWAISPLFVITKSCHLWNVWKYISVFRQQLFYLLLLVYCQRWIDNHVINTLSFCFKLYNVNNSASSKSFSITKATAALRLLSAIIAHDKACQILLKLVNVSHRYSKNKWKQDFLKYSVSIQKCTATKLLSEHARI